jgi:hypothetical protein
MIRGFSLLKGMPALLALVLLCPVSALAQAPDFIEFESGHVRPLAMSADGTRLFAVNTPNNALEIFSITASGLTLQSRVLEATDRGLAHQRHVAAVDPPDRPVLLLCVVRAHRDAVGRSGRAGKHVLFDVRCTGHQRAHAAGPFEFVPLARRTLDAMVDAPIASQEIETLWAATIGNCIGTSYRCKREQRCQQ